MIEDQRKMIKECLADDSNRLSEWEIQFLDSVNARLNSTGHPASAELSDKQLATLEKIWGKLYG